MFRVKLLTLNVGYQRLFVSRIVFEIELCVVNELRIQVDKPISSLFHNRKGYDKLLEAQSFHSRCFHRWL